MMKEFHDEDDFIKDIMGLINFHNWVLRFCALRNNFLGADSFCISVEDSLPDYNKLVGLIDADGYPFIGYRIKWNGEDSWLRPFQTPNKEIRYWTEVDSHGL